MANNDITLAEKLGVIPHLAIGLFHGSLRLATRTFGTSDGRPPTAYKDFIYATLRHLLSNVSVKQEKWLSPPTDTVYLNFARDKNFQPDTDVLPSGVKVHWVGNKSAEKVFLYFHGGGYVNAISPAHLEWLWSFPQTCLNRREWQLRSLVTLARRRASILCNSNRALRVSFGLWRLKARSPKMYATVPDR